MEKLNLKSIENQKANSFGMSLPVSDELFIKRRLEKLSERCPSSANLKLNLTKGKSRIEGSLEVNSFSEKFFSKKVATDPIQTYLLLEEDIDSQLLEWKRIRFSNSLFYELTGKMNIKETCA